MWFFLFLINGLVLCSGFYLLLSQNINALKNTAQDQTENNLKTFAAALSPLIVQHINDEDFFVKDIASRNPDFRITVVDKNGIVIADSDAVDISRLENHGSREEIRNALAGKEGKSVRRSTVSGTDVMYYAIPVIMDGSVHALRLSMPVNTSVFFSTGVRRTMLITGIIVMTVILLISFLISAHIVNGITSLQNATEKYREGNFDYRASVSSPRELQKLDESVTDMAVQLKSDIADITRKKDEFEAVFSGINEGLIVFDNAMNVLEYNAASADMFGTRKIDKLTMAGFVCNADILCLADSIVTNPSAAQDETETDIRTLKDTRRIHARCISIGKTESSGRFLLVISDITKISRLEQVRRDFVANVSHELKTPVTSIKGFTETLLETDNADKDTVHHFLEIIDSQSGRLMNIIEDLLTLSRLEQDSKKPDMIPSDIIETSRRVFAGFEHAAAERNLEMKFSTDHDSCAVLLNIGLYEQALGNIIDNAVKYCPAGSEIECVMTSTDSICTIVIQDTGTGIPPQYRERIFERFFRVDKGRSRDTGGTGLGLSITAHIIRIHGGTICETGRLDGKNGARFVIIMPVSEK